MHLGGLHDDADSGWRGNLCCLLHDRQQAKDEDEVGKVVDLRCMLT